MSKEKLRIDKTCLNCNYVVDERYCPHCGQENTLSRKTFHHLFIHFFEDLTHYDNAFWRTIFYLFFKPASLTKAYMAGKRLSFLAPIRLYIFVSFITFLLLSLFSNETTLVKNTLKKTNKNELIIPTIDSLHIEEKSVDGLTKVGILSQQNNDTIKKILQQTKIIDKKEVADFGYKSVNELDSIQKNANEKLKVSSTEYWFLKKWLAIKEDNSNEQIIEKFTTSFSHNLPKVLFMYMPVFAFLLWLFHDKKRWYYFDHGIFTLHYFSFLLLLILTLFFVDKLFPLLGKDPILKWTHFSIKSIGIFWMIYYFFPAHRRFYGDQFFTSLFKSGFIILINLVIISLLIILFALYTFTNLS
ncbi:DUF3667 domain-containing protein [Flavobacterium granuli]|uniref:Uncharacterized protein DUF3667 n=1 Tax=Flavobacterium granuli TaxID=280093 RepID=A0A1M5LZW0_9FLAO|nr:DUF3667 domain-containing protein [Flavobacterium granuli]PRZ24165.1 uncharacterized protein DUF3667 [Flavobacterium granuli]SHG70587.1 Protein of unknown function [Flavobacterium granuli]